MTLSLSRISELERLYGEARAAGNTWATAPKAGEVHDGAAHAFDAACRRFNAAMQSAFPALLASARYVQELAAQGDERAQQVIEEER